MNNAQIDELMNLLKKNESAIAALYEAFASHLPEYRTSWMAFAEEEHLHAKWIDTLHTHLKNESVSFDKVKFTVQSVHAAIGFIETQTAKLSSHPPDLRQALAMAINVEKSLLESAFFRVFKITGAKATAIQSRLEEATKAHFMRLSDWQAAER
jgi:hypothetical protein